MRILAVFFHPEKEATWLGGAEKRFLEFLKYLDEKRSKVEISVFEPTPSLIKEDFGNIKVFTVNRPFKANSEGLICYLGWVLWGFKALTRIIPVFSGKPPDLVLSPNNTLPTLLPAFMVKFLFNKPLCVVVHHFDFNANHGALNKKFWLISLFRNYRRVGYSFFAALVKALASCLAAAILRKSDKLIAVSRFSAKTLLGLGIEEGRVLVSGNGVKLEEISRLSCGSRKVFEGVFVGRISFEKGIYDLLDVWRIVTSRRKEACLAVVGEGKELEKFKARVKGLGLEENVKVFGGLPDKEMFRVLCESKVFIFPSRFEGWGLAVAEALACGLPVVCYEIPALKEVFGGCKSVFFVSNFSVEEFAKKVLWVLENFDLEELSYISKGFVEKFCWSKVFSKDLEFLFSGFK